MNPVALVSSKHPTVEESVIVWCGDKNSNELLYPFKEDKKNDEVKRFFHGGPSKRV